jgi:hypothetical protein
MSDCHMKRLERIQWRARRFCFGLMRSTHVLCVEVQAGLPPKRQKLSFLNERFLVSALVKPNNLFIVKLDELHRIWNNSNCLPEWQIVHESRMVSRTHFLNLHLVYLTFGMGLRGVVDESRVPIIAPRLLDEVPTVQRPRVWSKLGYFWMTGTYTALDCLDTLTDIFASIERMTCCFEPRGLWDIWGNLNMIFPWRGSHLQSFGYPSQGNKRADVLANVGSISGALD